jgi:hypothetical protein
VTVKIKDVTFTGRGRDVRDADEDATARWLIADKYPSTDEDDLTEWYESSLPIAIDLSV